MYHQRIYNPFSLLYLTLLVILLVLIIPFATIFLRQLFVQGVGIPPETVGLVLFMSLMGSFINIPLTTIESRGPVYAMREAKLFWVTWRIPTMRMGVRKTLITVNLGGAIVPLLISAYLLIFSIPRFSSNLILSYTKTLAVLLIVTFGTYRTSRVVKGLGIATPALGPPTITAIAMILINLISPLQCPTQIAYIGGTLGALIGADLSNINKLPDLGALVISIGGAGTFDGVYLTGLLSVILVLLLL
jgi:uncharacterized membrane protein